MTCLALFSELYPDTHFSKDLLCLLEAGHDGEHQWTPTDEVVITFKPEAKEDRP